MLSTKVKAFLKNRMKNKMLWIGIVSLLVELNLGGIIELPSNFESVASNLLNVLVFLGILNNPSTASQSLFVDNDNDGIADEFQKDDNEQAKG